MLSVVKPKDNKAQATGIVLVGAIAFVIGAILIWAILSRLSVSSPPTSLRENDVLQMYPPLRRAGCGDAG